MHSAVSLAPLVGVAIMLLGFALRFNPMLIVILAAISSGLAAHFGIVQILAAIGNGFVRTKTVPLILLLPLATIGLLERHGLRERAQMWISKIHAATPGRLLVIYLFAREFSAALGLTGLGGHPQMVRPLIAPMAEGAAETHFGKLNDTTRSRLRAFCASADNVGLFFGEDVFVAISAVALMVTFLKEAGIFVEPMHVALWGLPTAVAAFVVHGIRVYRIDHWLAKQKTIPATSGSTAKRIEGENA